MTDAFSHTAYGLPWANYEWLSQWVFYVPVCPWWDAAPRGSLRLASIWRMPTRLDSDAGCGSRPRAGSDDLVAVDHARWALRPQVFTIFLFSLTMYLSVRGRLWPLPAVFFLWANLHGAVALGFVLLLGDVIVAVSMRRGIEARIVFGTLSFGAPCSRRLAFDTGRKYFALYCVRERTRLKSGNRRRSACGTHGFGWRWLASSTL